MTAVKPVLRLIQSPDPQRPRWPAGVAVLSLLCVFVTGFSSLHQIREVTAEARIAREEALVSRQEAERMRRETEALRRDVTAKLLEMSLQLKREKEAQRRVNHVD